MWRNGWEMGVEIDEEGGRRVDKSGRRGKRWEDMRTQGRRREKKRELTPTNL